MQFLLDFYGENPHITIVTSLVFAYWTYYIFIAVKPPRIAGNKKFKAFLSRHCGIIQEKFWPTFWCFETRIHTLVGFFLRSFPSIDYKRELLQMPDGGQTALDWYEDDRFPACKSKPTVIILPGITGSSGENYVLHLVKSAAEMGYRAAVFNNRGVGGMELKTGRTYCAANSDDLQLVVKHVKSRYPDSLMMGVGVSMGGMVLANYCARVGVDCGFVAVMIISTPWDTFAAADSLESPLNHLVFNRHLTSVLKTMVKKNLDVLAKKDWFIDDVWKSSCIREFDEAFTARQFGYSSVQEYYKDAALDYKVVDFPIPLLSLNAADDVFSPGHAIPVNEAEKSKNVVIVLTSHGGHMGFLEGFYPRDSSYMTRVYSQYLKAVMENLDEFKATFM